ncbi:MAG: hypothetical protein U1E65_08905 [Myxococcota bacterium]
MRSMAALLCLSLLACTASPTMGTDPGPTPSPSPSPSPTMSPPPVTTTSYYRDVQPILERSCNGCHVTGGIAPLAFDDPATTAGYASAINAQIASGKMPPFYASAGCNSYQHDPRLSPQEAALVATWASEGGPLGDAKDAAHAMPIAPTTVRHDTMMDIGGDFDARLMSETDNYRCFVMDPGAATDIMVSGYEVIPGNKRIVHHVLAYLVAPADVPTLVANDAADPGLGYSCMAGGVNVPGAIGNQVAGWVPGASATRLPEGTGIEVAAGSKIVIQIHYNLLGAGSGSTLDKTTLALETAPAGSLTPARILPMVKHNLAIAAYDANSVQVQELTLPRANVGSSIYRLTGHMHMLGKEVKLEAVHRDGSSTCLLDIPTWDFQWQREYSLTTPYLVQTGDKLRITCVYDNSAAHQPVVNGVQQTPRDVTWGESSLDEMCMTYMTFTQR